MRATRTVESPNHNTRREQSKGKYVGAVNLMNNLPAMFSDYLKYWRVHTVNWDSPTQERVSDEAVKAEMWTCERHLTPVEDIPVGKICPVCQHSEEKR